MDKRFYYEGEQFFLDGEKFLLRSGAMHYFRIPKAYWKDRLLKLKECGFNCVETYIPWNLHEPEEGVFDFSGELDFGEYIDEAASLGLQAIVRAGPYICAEWENGGLPYWLGRYEKCIRTSHPVFMEKVTNYFERVFAYVRPRLVENGGNILMVQVENEYSHFGEDTGYLSALESFYAEHLPEALLFTADNCDEKGFRLGSLPNRLLCGNFGSAVEENMRKIHAVRPNQPKVCMEFWSGWFDHWGEEHHTRPVEEKLACLESFFQKEYHFNMYMFHGGTNFGFTSGANLWEDGTYAPIVTSYDYDSPLTEWGDRTPCYYAIRALIEKYYGRLPSTTAKESDKYAYGDIRFDGYAPLFSQLSKVGSVQTQNEPRSFEESGQAYGYAYYQTEMAEDGEFLFKAHDRATLYQNGERIGSFMRREGESSRAQVKRGPLGIFVENLGRINFGSKVFDKKGLLHAKGKTKGAWLRVSLPMRDLSGVMFSILPTKSAFGPAFYRGKFTVEKVGDTFLKTEGFQRGFVVVNGFNLGRFDNAAGPTKTLYVPKTVLREGDNEVVVFDTEGGVCAKASLVAAAQL